MTEHPIIFSGEMIRAIFAGRKTQTRRVVKPQPAWWDGGYAFFHKGTPYMAKDYLKFCPYGTPGDRLWVRETWYCDNPATAQDLMSRCETLYHKATEVHPEIFKWKPSIFMPRWASRITLEIVNIRIERLQEITEEDAIREGFAMTEIGATARTCFRITWDSLNGKDKCIYYKDDNGKRRWRIQPGYPWASNPWVRVIEFRRLP